MMITNTDRGPRGFWRNGKLVVLDPGGSFAGEISEEDAAAARTTGFFEFDSAAEAPIPDATRQVDIQTAIKGLDEADFTKGGKPEVDAINVLMPEDADPVTAAERDEVWAAMNGEAT